jgi:hypothetical protein
VTRVNLELSKFTNAVSESSSSLITPQKDLFDGLFKTTEKTANKKDANTNTIKITEEASVSETKDIENSPIKPDSRYSKELDVISERSARSEMTTDTQNPDISGKSTISEVSAEVDAGMNVERLTDTFQITSESTDDGMNVARQVNTIQITSESTDVDLDDVTDSRSDIQVEYSQDNAARLEERIEKTLDVGADTETRGSMGAEGVNRGPLLSDSQGSTVTGSKSESDAIVDTQEGTTEADSMTNFESKINTGIDKVSTLNPLEQELNNPFARSLGPPKPSNSQGIKLGSNSFSIFSVI